MPLSTIYQLYIGRTVALKRKSLISYSEDIPIVVVNMFEEDLIVVLRRQISSAVMSILTWNHVCPRIPQSGLLFLQVVPITCINIKTVDLVRFCGKRMFFQ
jgi:hypothetical protein